MADLGEDFDPTSVDPRTNFDPLPSGKYPAEIVESDVIVPRSGRGKMLKLTLRITEGEYENRKVFDNINFRHENSQTQEIAQRALAELCAACGHHGPLTDSEVLHGIPIVAKVKYVGEEKKDGKTYDPKNEIKNYLPRDGANAAPPQNRTSPTGGAVAHKASTTTAAPSTTKKPLPWEKPKTHATAAA